MFLSCVNSCVLLCTTIDMTPHCISSVSAWNSGGKTQHVRLSFQGENIFELLCNETHNRVVNAGLRGLSDKGRDKCCLSLRLDR